MNSNTDNTYSCPICSGLMKKDLYAYDNNQYGKTYYKCTDCGHKEVKIE